MKRFIQTTAAGGFSFIELLMAVAVFSILIGSVFGFFNSQRRTYLREDLKLERDQNLRVAMGTISRELSMAGYRAADAAFIQGLSSWAPTAFVPAYPLSVTLDANPKITLGDGNLPDMITFACSLPAASNPTTLLSNSEETKLTLSLSKTEVKRQYRVGDIVFVGYLPEYARVAGISGRTLTIDSDPETSGHQPLSEEYPAGAPVGEVSVVTYAVFNDDNDPACKRHEAGHPLLKRKVNAGGFYPVAENIAQMKVSRPEADVLRVVLTALMDRRHLLGFHGGAVESTAEISLRNTSGAVLATDCIKPAAPSGLNIAGGPDEAFPCQVLLSWNPVDTDSSGNDLSDAGCPVTGYRIFYDVAAGVFGHYVDVAAEDAEGYILDVSGLPSGEFHIAVSAENSGGVGEKSPEVSIVDGTPPEEPSGISASSGGVGTVALAWDENVECDLAGYLVYRKKGAGGFELTTAAIVSRATGGYLDSGLDDGFSYTYAVKAVDYGFNTSSFSEEVTIVLP